MRKYESCVILGVILLCCLVSIHLGRLTCNPWLTITAGIGLCYLMLRIAHLTRALAGKVSAPQQTDLQEAP